MNSIIKKQSNIEGQKSKNTAAITNNGCPVLINRQLADRPESHPVLINRQLADRPESQNTELRTQNYKLLTVNY
jgi:hypothetical protein